MNNPAMYNEEFDVDVVEVLIPGSMEHLLNQLNNAIEKKLHDYYHKFRLVDLNLDPRGGGHIWVDVNNVECVVIRRENKLTFNYYCGGEYVNADCIHIIGDYVIYMNDGENRVDDWIRAAIEYEETEIK